MFRITRRTKSTAPAAPVYTGTAPELDYPPRVSTAPALDDTPRVSTAVARDIDSFSPARSEYEVLVSNRAWSLADAVGYRRPTAAMFRAASAHVARYGH